MSSVQGSATDEQKSTVVQVRNRFDRSTSLVHAVELFRDFCGAEGHFAAEQARRIVVTQLDYETRPEEELGARQVARMVCEIKIEKDMLHNANAVSSPEL
jgi:hypothetical protein